MIKEFRNLNEHETELMLKAPFLVCILIAGADGTIDNREIREAISFAQKSKKSVSAMGAYFKELTQDFEDKLRILIQSYPHNSAQRGEAIGKELSGLNTVWSKLPPAFATLFYDLLKQMAARIAESSGGLLGIKSIGSEEARLVDLNMIKAPAS